MKNLSILGMLGLVWNVSETSRIMGLATHPILISSHISFYHNCLIEFRPYHQLELKWAHKKWVLGERGNSFNEIIDFEVEESGLRHKYWGI